MGTTVWVSAGGQLEYYPYVGHAAQYGKSAGTLLGAEPMVVKDAVEQVAPKSATFRIPGGDKQVLLVFTLPNDTKEYAVPVGYNRTRTSRSIRTRSFSMTIRMSCTSTGSPGLACKTNIAEIVCPFTGERLAAVAALRPDVTVIHAQQADRACNVQYWGITGVQKEAVLAATRSVVTVEEIVDVLEPRPGAVLLPTWAVGHVAVAPGGSHPSYALGYSIRDNDSYVAWDAISRDRDAFGRWLDEISLLRCTGRSWCFSC